MDDVRKLYVLLWPGAHSVREEKLGRSMGNRGDEEPERLISISKKTLPEIGRHERIFGFVDRVSRRVVEVEDDLEAKDYTTRSRGERHVEGARPVGEGVYALVAHGGRTHLAYVLELPEQLTPIQEAFHIRKEGSYLVMVKNPEEGVSLLGDNRAHYPPELMKQFEGRGMKCSFAPATPGLLDYENAELLLIGATEDLKTELGDAGEYLEELGKAGAREITNESIWKDLRMTKAEHPTEPLLRGKWR